MELENVNNDLETRMCIFVETSTEFVDSVTTCIVTCSCCRALHCRKNILKISVNHFYNSNIDKFVLMLQIETVFFYIRCLKKPDPYD